MQKGIKPDTRRRERLHGKCGNPRCRVAFPSLVVGLTNLQTPLSTLAGRDWLGKNCLLVLPSTEDCQGSRSLGVYLDSKQHSSTIAVRAFVKSSVFMRISTTRTRSTLSGILLVHWRILVNFNTTQIIMDRVQVSHAV